ncbi:unnamed protein product [Acanthoscelides obtectus]|uniref:Ig-like domain-containing protein n=1 Tax=Acanthoscelides obtectus TaxID=200917 RepID=A0A9P0PTG3_ACAOB|nr:unnamed protein product [Acanthoscelides obtectus]CAK1675876.1 hypothetical protein AOBTE_LOCUS30457 [Acanthoscelides obtectus]
MFVVRIFAVLLMVFEQSCCESVTGSDAEIVRAHIGTNVSLPCRVDTKQCGQLHSVKWYKDANRVYVLSHAGQGRAEAER